MRVFRIASPASSSAHQHSPTSPSVLTELHLFLPGPASLPGIGGATGSQRRGPLPALNVSPRVAQNRAELVSGECLSFHIVCPMSSVDYRFLNSRLACPRLGRRRGPLHRHRWATTAVATSLSISRSDSSSRQLFDSHTDLRDLTSPSPCSPRSYLMLNGKSQIHSRPSTSHRLCFGRGYWGSLRQSCHIRSDPCRFRPWRRPTARLANPWLFSTGRWLDSFSSKQPHVRAPT